MPDFKDRMADYVPVSERIGEFYAAYPHGSIQSEIIELGENRVTVKAYAYRQPDDPRPGIGHSSCVVPGSTPYTKGSEIENAETSAWGRAIAALGFEVKRGIASSEEVAMKQPGRGERTQATEVAATATTPAPVTYRRSELIALMAEKGMDYKAAEDYATLIGIPKDERPMSDASMDRLITAMAGHGTDEPLELALGGAETAPEPPKPGTDEYVALAATDKANARAYWAKQEVIA